MYITGHLRGIGVGGLGQAGQARVHVQQLAAIRIPQRQDVVPASLRRVWGWGSRFGAQGLGPRVIQRLGLRVQG